MDEAEIKGIRTASLSTCHLDCLGNVFVNLADCYGIKRKSLFFIASFVTATASPVETLILLRQIE
jgi:hypothetical protein